MQHTEQLQRFKIQNDQVEFSIFRRRQATTGRRSCSSRIWTLRRDRSTGQLIRARITRSDYDILTTLFDNTERGQKCEALVASSKHRSFGHETPEIEINQK